MINDSQVIEELSELLEKKEEWYVKQKKILEDIYYDKTAVDMKEEDRIKLGYYTGMIFLVGVILKNELRELEESQNFSSKKLKKLIEKKISKRKKGESEVDSSILFFWEEVKEKLTS